MFKKHPVEAEAAIIGVVPVQVVEDSDALDDVEFELITEPLEAEMRPVAADAQAGATGPR